MTRSISRRRGARRLPWWIRRAVRWWARWGGRPALLGQPASAVLAAGELPAPPPPDERRCGWFDSSLDLREGLAVNELEPGHAVEAQLPVMAWVQLQLCGWRPRVEGGGAPPAGGAAGARMPA